MKFDIKKLRHELITKRMIEKRISLSETAQQIGVSKATLSRIESDAMNGKPPSICTFIKIVEWLGHKPGDYFIDSVKTNKT